MAKVLFINPVVREEDEPRHIPYGIALLASIIMEKGHQVQIYDHNAWRAGDEVLRQVIEADQWDVIGLGGITTAYGSIKHIVGIARRLRPKSVIVLGGGVLTSIPAEIMTFLPEVDVGVIGEAFVTFPEMLEMIDLKKRDWHLIDGTITRKKEGGFIFSKPRKIIPDLDVLPYPAWDLFPLEEVYFKNSQVLFSEEGMLARRRLDINGSFGCSLICRFCFHLGLAGDMRYEANEKGETRVAFDEPGNYTRTNRYHSPDYIVNMALHARKKYDIDFVGFLDENLMTMDSFSNRTWLKQVCDLWVEAGLQPTCIRDGIPHDENCKGVHWSGTSHASLCKPESLKMMRRAGCSHLVYGYESFSTQILKRLGKGTTPKANFRSFFWTMESGIRPVPNQIIGFPTEDFDSIYDTMEAWKKLGLVVKPFFATPYPGSEWFTTYRKSIEQQYGGDLEKFLLDLGDATRITALICEKFNAVELLGLRELMIQFDEKRIREYQKLKEGPGLKIVSSV